MATDLESRKSISKNEAFLQQEFAGLCARIRRVDLVTGLLTLSISVALYAFVMGLFDLFIGSSPAGWIDPVRWGAYVAFLGLVVFLLARLVRGMFRPVNPYYVAHQLEQTLPGAKNSLINWLDLYQEELPAAFRMNLSANAAENFKECDAEPVVRKRKNRVLLGVLALPALGLVILLLLGPHAFLSSMVRAFLPFLGTPVATRTQVTLLQPDSPDAEVSPLQSITFVAKIEGHVPTGHRSDAPKLRYRYQASEEERGLSLQQEENGTWTAQLLPEQLRTGFSYRLTAGDAATPEYRVRVRANAHVKKFEITYHHRAYRRPTVTKATFPSALASVPMIHGPRGTQVEFVLHASRPVQKGSVELLLGNNTRELPGRILDGDPSSFVCRWTLEQAGQFRVLFTSLDGEENTDRGTYEISVVTDPAPVVQLTQPDKDVSLPENGTLELEGRASSGLGLKSLTLHFRTNDPNTPTLAPKPYRPDHSFRFGAGTYPDVIDYRDVVALDQLKDDKGTIHLLPPGTVLEYWLEAVDAADYPNPHGNVGKSEPVRKITLLPKSKETKESADARKRAMDKQKNHEKQQDDTLAQENEKRKKEGAGGGTQNDQNQPSQADNSLESQKEEIKNALKKEEENKKRGGAKGAGQNSSESKSDSQDSSGAPEPKNKGGQPMSPDHAGNTKEQDPKQGAGGASKDGGAKAKEAPASPGQPKGIEKEGPDLPNKDMQTGATPMNEPNAQAKGSKTDPDTGQAKGEPKPASPEQAKQAGQSRGDGPDSGKKAPTWQDVAAAIQDLPKHDAAGAAAGKKLADIAKEASDPRMSKMAAEALLANDRDPKTGKEVETKVPPKTSGGNSKKEEKGSKTLNPFGTNGPPKRKGDASAAAAANREFLRRIGQLQLDDWKKRMTPDLLKKAGLSEADWRRFLTDMQRYDERVRQLNAKLARTPDPHSTPRPAVGSTPRLIDVPRATNDSLEAGAALPPPDLRDAQRRFSTAPEQK